MNDLIELQQNWVDNIAASQAPQLDCLVCGLPVLSTNLQQDQSKIQMTQLASNGYSTVLDGDSKLRKFMVDEFVVSTIVKCGWKRGLTSFGDIKQKAIGHDSNLMTVVATSSPQGRQQFAQSSSCMIAMDRIPIDECKPGLSVLISWGRVRERVYRHCYIEFVEQFASSDQSRPLSITVLVCPWIDTAQQGQPGKYSPLALHMGITPLRLRVRSNECDFCKAPLGSRGGATSFSCGEVLATQHHMLLLQSHLQSQALAHAMTGTLTRQTLNSAGLDYEGRGSSMLNDCLMTALGKLSSLTTGIVAAASLGLEEAVTVAATSSAAAAMMMSSTTDNAPNSSAAANLMMGTTPREPKNASAKTKDKDKNKPTSITSSSTSSSSSPRATSVTATAAPAVSTPSAPPPLVNHHVTHVRAGKRHTSAMLTSCRTACRIVEDVCLFLTHAFQCSTMLQPVASSAHEAVKLTSRSDSSDTFGAGSGPLPPSTPFPERWGYSFDQLNSFLQSLVGVVSCLVRVVVSTPVPFVCVVRLWAHTLCAILDARSAVYFVLASAQAAAGEYFQQEFEALSDLTCVCGDLDSALEDHKSLVISAVSDMIETNFVDDIIREEWQSNSVFRKNQRVSHGISATLMVCKGFVHDLLVTCHHHKHACLDISMQLLTAVTKAITDCYSALAPSRTRCWQWRTDLATFSLHIIRTYAHLLTVIGCTSPVPASSNSNTTNKTSSHGSKHSCHQGHERDTAAVSVSPGGLQCVNEQGQWYQRVSRQCHSECNALPVTTQALGDCIVNNSGTNDTDTTNIFSRITKQSSQPQLHSASSSVLGVGTMSETSTAPPSSSTAAAAAAATVPLGAVHVAPPPSAVSASNVFHSRIEALAASHTPVIHTADRHGHQQPLHAAPAAAVAAVASSVSVSVELSPSRSMPLAGRLPPLSLPSSVSQAALLTRERSGGGGGDAAVASAGDAAGLVVMPPSLTQAACCRPDKWSECLHTETVAMFLAELCKCLVLYALRTSVDVDKLEVDLHTHFSLKPQASSSSSSLLSTSSASLCSAALLSDPLATCNLLCEVYGLSWFDSNPLVGSSVLFDSIHEFASVVGDVAAVHALSEMSVSDRSELFKLYNELCMHTTISSSSSSSSSAVGTDVLHKRNQWLARHFQRRYELIETDYPPLTDSELANRAILRQIVDDLLPSTKL